MKNILMVIPFADIYPPMNGGMLRCFNLLNQLCRHFNVTAIMHQDKESFMKAATVFPEIGKCQVISTRDQHRPRSFFSLLPAKYGNALQYRFWNRSVYGPAGANYLSLYPQLKQYLKNNKTDYVILEDMEILNLSKLVKRYQPGTPVIYDAYNVNTVLAAAALEKKEISRQDFELVKIAETSLSAYADIVFTCSENDLIDIRRMNQEKIKGTVVPNGVVIPQPVKVENNKYQSPDILFCGSMDYSPNREGLIWFLSNVFELVLEKIPNARLLVVGRGNPGEELSLLLQHPAVINYGIVDSVNMYYQKAAVAIVPLLSGSGTRLKLLEAMAYNTAIIATTIGAEGISYTNGKNILIGDEPQAFAASVVQLLSSPVLAAEMANEAFSFVQKKYDWNIIGDGMSTYLNTLKN